MSIFSIFTADWFEMMFRFGINIIFNSLIIAIGIRYRKERTSYMFTFFLVSIIIFFLCFTLKKFDLNLGLALGLFAIFGIIRYRTETLKANEMTYLFVTIGVSLINALSNDKMSLIEIFTINIIVVLSVYIFERFFLVKSDFLIARNKQILSSEEESIKMNIILPYSETESSKKIESHIKELEKNLSIKVHFYQVIKVDYNLLVFHVNLYYNPEK